MSEHSIHHSKRLWNWPLSFTEFSALISKVQVNRELSLLQEDLDALYSLTEGNPLFLTSLLEEFKKGVLSLKQLPSTLSDLYYSILTHLKEKGKYDLVMNIFGVLTVSQKFLSEKELRMILPEYRFKVGEGLVLVRELLKTDGDYFRLYHRALEDYLQAEHFSEYDLLEFHQKMIDYIQPCEKKNLDYGYRYIFHHLYEAKRFKEIKQLIDDAQSKTTQYFPYKEKNYPDEALLDDYMFGLKAALVDTDDMYFYNIAKYGLDYIATNDAFLQKLDQILDWCVDGEWEKAKSRARMLNSEHLRFSALLLIALTMLDHKDTVQETESLFQEILEYSHIVFRQTSELFHITQDDFYQLYIISELLCAGSDQFLRLKIEDRGKTRIVEMLGCCKQYEKALTVINEIQDQYWLGEALRILLSSLSDSDINDKMNLFEKIKDIIGGVEEGKREIVVFEITHIIKYLQPIDYHSKNQNYYHFWPFKLENVGLLNMAFR